MIKKSVSQLKKMLWKEFSIFIRQRDSNDSGYGNCVTCGTHKFWREVDAGHFITRGDLATCFDERNVHFQCKRCNMRGGEQHKMSIYIDNKYGVGTSDHLQWLRHQPTKISRSEYVELINKYKEINGSSKK